MRVEGAEIGMLTTVFVDDEVVVAGVVAGVVVVVVVGGVVVVDRGGTAQDPSACTTIFAGLQVKHHPLLLL